MDEEYELKQLAKTLRRLMVASDNDWIPWSRLAREHTGSDVDVWKIQGYVDLPEAAQYFVKARAGVVRLSLAGLEFAQDECASLTPEETAVRQIENAIRGYARSLQDRALPIERISSLTEMGGKVVCAVHVQVDDDLVANDTPVKVTWNIEGQRGKDIEGIVVGQEPDGSVLYVALDYSPSLAAIPQHLIIRRSYLLSLLADQFNQLSSVPPLALPLLSNSPLAEEIIANEDSLEVARILFSMQTPWTKLLWGPPGAGKTFAIADFVVNLLQEEPDSNVLLVAPSNRAVDVAVDRLVERLEKHQLQSMIAERQILRFGFPRKRSVLERPDLLGDKTLDELNSRVKSLSSQIGEKESGHSNHDDAELAFLRSQLIGIQEQVKEVVHEHVATCRVVATTTTLAYLKTSPVSTKRWNTVVVDEVTMVPPAVCTFIASLATERLLLAGDPRQLGPVYESDRCKDPSVYRWMGRDIFDRAGLSRGTGVARSISIDDGRMARITCQRRCVRKIWSHVQHLYPTISHRVKRNASKAIADLPPLEGQPQGQRALWEELANWEDSRPAW